VSNESPFKRNRFSKKYYMWRAETRRVIKALCGSSCHHWRCTLTRFFENVLGGTGILSRCGKNIRSYLPVG
jgi:hypothetical protein